MNNGDKLIREDGVEFVCIEPGHWSLVVPVSVQSGAVEERVKFVYHDKVGDQYIGFDTTMSYTLVPA